MPVSEDGAPNAAPAAGDEATGPPCLLEIDLRVAGDRAVCVLRGQFDAFEVPRVRQRLTPLLDAGVHEVEFDLGDVRLVDSAALRFLTLSATFLNERGGHLHVRRMNRRLLRMLRLVDLDQAARTGSDAER